MSFGIHKSKLLKESIVFRELLESTQVHSIASDDGTVTAENGIRTVHLPNEDPSAFKCFYTYLYEQHSLVSGNESITDITWSGLFDVWLFGLKFKIPGLQNAVVDATIEKHREDKTLPGPVDINRLYKKNVKAASFRELFIDLFTSSCDLEVKIHKPGSYNTQFLVALISTLYRNQVKSEEEGKHKRAKFRASRREKYYAYGEVNPLRLDDEA